MGDFQISTSVEINRPAEAVFQYITDMSKTQAWRQNVDIQDYSGDPFGVGSAWKDVTSFLGRDIVAKNEVTAVEEGRGYTMKQKADGISGHASLKIVPGSPESCTVTLAFDGKTSGWFAGLASGLMKGQAEKRMKADLSNLKANLESS